MAQFRALKTQVLLLEMQPEIVAASQTVPSDQLRRAAKALQEVTAAADVEVIASVVPLGDKPPALIGELGALRLVTRSTVSPFDDPAVANRLRSSTRNVLAIGGISSEIAVLHTVLDARRLGYEVHVLSDLCGGLNSRTEQAAFARMLAAGALPSCISSFATSLIGDMNTAIGRSIMQTLGCYHGWSAHGQGDREQSADPIDAAIEDLFTAMGAAWRRGDASGFARLFSEDARFVAFDGSVLIGPEQIAAYHEAPFATHLAGTELRFGPLEVRPIGSMIYAVGSEGGISRNGDMTGELIGESAQTFVLTKENGVMRIVSFQNTRIRKINGSAAAEVWRRFDNAWQELNDLLSHHQGEQPA